MERTADWLAKAQKVLKAEIESDTGALPEADVPRGEADARSYPTVKEQAAAIVQREGGYAENEHEPGGAVIYGVTLKTLRDVEDNQSLTKEDLKRIVTKRYAVNLFVSEFYRRPRIMQIPGPGRLRANMFDMSVNSGPDDPIKLLQNLVEAPVDGRIGPATISATARMQEGDPETFADAFGIERRRFLFRIADRRPHRRPLCVREKDGQILKGGWITRAELFIREDHHLTTAELMERTAEWRNDT